MPLRKETRDEDISDGGMMIFGSDGMDDAFDGVMPTVQQIYDAVPVENASEPEKNPAAEEKVPAQDSGPSINELWNAAVKKAVGEKPMLIRIETKAHPVAIRNGVLYVTADDEYTEKVLMEKGKEIVESKLTMYYGSPLTLCMEQGSASPVSDADQEKEQEVEDIARQIGQRFHMKVDIE